MTDFLNFRCFYAVKNYLQNGIRGVDSSTILIKFLKQMGYKSMLMYFWLAGNAHLGYVICNHANFCTLLQSVSQEISSLINQDNSEH